MNKTLTDRASSTGWKAVNLPHLSSSTIRVVPHRSLSRAQGILIQVDGPNTSHGTTAMIQRRYRNGTVTHAMIPLNTTGTRSCSSGFNRASISSMYVVVSNTSTPMRNCGRVTTYGGP